MNEDNESRASIVRKNTKSKSQIMKTETMKKMNTIEKIFIEGIQRNSDFEELLSDPRIMNLCNNDI